MKQGRKITDLNEEMWTTLSRRVFETAADVLGYSKKKNSDWFNENDEEIKGIIEERNQALQAKLSNPSRTNKERL